MRRNYIETSKARSTRNATATVQLTMQQDNFGDLYNISI